MQYYTLIQYLFINDNTLLININVLMFRVGEISSMRFMENVSHLSVHYKLEDIR